MSCAIGQPAPELLETFTDEMALVKQLIPLEGANVIDIGCGNGAFSRRLLLEGGAKHVLALDTDVAQMEKNLATERPEGLTFELSGAQSIPAVTASQDAAFFFKSFHHVPQAFMATALTEVRRCLRTGGLVYVSEPVAAGEFDALMRIFHDEELVRNQALQALRWAADTGTLVHRQEKYFLAPMAFSDFEDFKRRMMYVTHRPADFDEATTARIRAQFEQHMTPEGVAFLRPVRVNVFSVPV